MSKRTLSRRIKAAGVQRHRPHSLERSDAWIDDIKEMVRCGQKRDVILHHLQKTHSEQISVRTLNNIMRVSEPAASILLSKTKGGVQAHGIQYHEEIPETLVDQMVALESKNDGSAMGYRTMTVRIRNVYDVNVPRDVIAASQSRLDETAVKERKKRKLTRREYIVAGPNALWHNDGMDKISRFGFAIHACIDGWSRRLIWLRVAPSNRLPEFVLAYYLAAVQQVNKLPLRQRSDRGAENQLTCKFNLFEFLRTSDAALAFRCRAVSICGPGGTYLGSIYCQSKDRELVEPTAAVGSAILDRFLFRARVRCIVRLQGPIRARLCIFYFWEAYLRHT